MDVKILFHRHALSGSILDVNLALDSCAGPFHTHQGKALPHTTDSYLHQ